VTGAVADELVPEPEELEEVAVEGVAVTGAVADELVPEPEELEEVAVEGVAVTGAVADVLVPEPEVVPEEAVTCATADETTPVAREMSDELSAADALAVQSVLAPRARMPAATARTNLRRAQGTIGS
jgi:hypothetical protein